MLCDPLCSLLLRQGVNGNVVRPAKTDLAAADLFLEMARVSVLGEETVATELCNIVLYLDCATPEAAGVVTRSVGRLAELVGATTLDSEDVSDIERMLQEGTSVEEMQKRFSRSKIPA